VKLRVDNPRWGARTLHTKLVQAGLGRPPVVSTIHRVLQWHGLVVAQEHRAPKEWKRFERHAPNDLWQIDGTMVALADGSKAWIVDLLDDHARYAIGATAVRRFTVHAAWKAMDTAITEHGVPRRLISDKGLQFKSRKGQKPVFFQERLAALNIHQLNSRPGTRRRAGSSSGITAPSKSSMPTTAPPPRSRNCKNYVTDSAGTTTTNGHTVPSTNRRPRSSMTHRGR